MMIEKTNLNFKILKSKRCENRVCFFFGFNSCTQRAASNWMAFGVNVNNVTALVFSFSGFCLFFFFVNCEKLEFDVNTAHILEVNAWITACGILNRINNACSSDTVLFFFSTQKRFFPCTLSAISMNKLENWAKHQKMNWIGIGSGISLNELMKWNCFIDNTKYFRKNAKSNHAIRLTHNIQFN